MKIIFIMRILRSTAKSREKYRSSQFTQLIWAVHLRWVEINQKIFGNFWNQIDTHKWCTLFQFVTIVDSKVAFRTNRNAPNFRIVWIDLENPAEENWTTIIEVNKIDMIWLNIITWNFLEYSHTGTFVRHFDSSNPCERWYSLDRLFAWC